MLAIKLTCPHCGSHLKTTKPPQAGRRVLCSHCGRSFASLPETNGNGAVHREGVIEKPSPTSPPLPPPVEAVMEKPQANLPPVDTAINKPAADVRSPITPPVRHQALWIGVILGGLLLSVATTLGLVVYFALRGGPSDVPIAAAATTHKESETPNSDNSPLDSNSLLPPPPPNNEILPPPPSSQGRDAPPPLTVPAPSSPPEAAWLPSGEQEKVNKAIERGVQWLKTHQRPDGTWSGGAHPTARAAMPALTLLECGVTANDPRIRKAHEYVRKTVPKLNQTYDLALVILFLDRLGDVQDEKYIRTCALRLAAGQHPSGGWTYTCPRLPNSLEKELLLIMQQGGPRSALDLFVGAGEDSLLGKALQSESLESKLLTPGSTIPLDADTYKKRLQQLPKNLRDLAALQPATKAHKMPAGDGTDNSNTQFAILGLSAAQRHDLPLERTLALLVRRFRVSQAPDGHWGYRYSIRPQGGSPAMTGAGLLGLAVEVGLAADHSASRERNAHFKDAGIEKAFAFLGRSIDNPRTPFNLYLMWTVERCGVLFNRRKIADKDWYRWAEEKIRAHQQKDGSWTRGGYPAAIPIADTCFALLVLKRANLAKNLTKKLEFFLEGKSLR